ncbi:major histocompatibility complex class I-related gene protein-like isoform X2 [Myxocyprinus asiaticus]|uniref:major histocompatibility complex class I-related gene protein-like isoform X2 n=1 Tax=Myxocyprinus asiaticus TaxID=70543 RepID=UPI002222012B|nr:major histocompatibility complex class I-related gene protein-like isoform X2 [Myxocyprinus asiaticus]
MLCLLYVLLYLTGIKAGVHVYQRLVGCELLNNDQPGLLYTWEAFNGKMKEEGIFDMEKKEFQMKLPWMKAWDQLRWLRLKLMFENIYHPVCIKILQRYLSLKKNNVMRKVKPKVRFLKKTLTESDRVQITCLATGFYPRHINLTLFRDGQPVEDEVITGGQVLPNGDGTYQMRKSLVISVEELRQGHNYNCTMNYLSLNNKLDIKFDVEESYPGSSTLSIVISVVMLLLLAVLIIITLTKCRKRRAAGSRTSLQSDYSPTTTTAQDAT